MSEQRKTTITVTINQTEEPGCPPIDVAVAHVHGMGVRGVVEVPIIGSKSEAMAEAVRLAGERLGIDPEPAGYYNSQGVVGL